MAHPRSAAEDFRLSRLARTRYRLADLTLAADLATARTIAARVNAVRMAAVAAGGDVTAEPRGRGRCGDGPAPSSRPGSTRRRAP